jgi:hypothetical protein
MKRPVLDEVQTHPTIRERLGSPNETLAVVGGADEVEKLLESGGLSELLKAH